MRVGNESLAYKYLGLDLDAGRDLIPRIPTMAPRPIIAAVPAPSFPANRMFKISDSKKF